MARTKKVVYRGQVYDVEVKSHRRKSVKVRAYCRRRPGRRRNTPASKMPF